MIMSRPREKMQCNVKPMVISEIQVRFLLKTTDITNDKNANPNDDILCMRGKEIIFCALRQLQVCNWGISTELQCLRGKLF